MHAHEKDEMQSMITCNSPTTKEVSALASERAFWKICSSDSDLSCSMESMRLLSEESGGEEGSTLTRKLKTLPKRDCCGASRKDVRSALLSKSSKASSKTMRNRFTRKRQMKKQRRRRSQKLQAASDFSGACAKDLDLLITSRIWR